MRVHVFGNSPSPAVATLGLGKAAQASELEFGSHVTNFVTRASMLTTKQTRSSERNFINDKQFSRSSDFGSGDYTRETPIEKIVSETVDWDQPLTDETADEWNLERYFNSYRNTGHSTYLCAYLSKTATRSYMYSPMHQKKL
ncbi:Hypothetical predicted protein [Mytilus galloprovincialis]|uniref:Uncharacterized protein n=1 Tax=Mytilus galloprovincialis TaxID=29158 RepID=A0A8B6G1P2_MYTGA|nr:Hypothetical predicted protein [Mytilus galloprovincialis]